MVAFPHLVALTSARAQMVWCDAAAEGCALYPKAFPRTPPSCESGNHAMKRTPAYICDRNEQKSKKNVQTLASKYTEMGIFVNTATTNMHKNK